MTLYGSTTQDSREESLSLSYRTYERLKQDELRSQRVRDKSGQESSSDESELNNDETTKILEGDRTTSLSAGSNRVVEASASRKAVVMVACIYLQVCTSGLVYALGVIYADLIPTLNASRSMAALVQTLYMGVTYGGGVFMIVPIRKYGAAKCVMVGAMVTAIALMMSFFATNIETLIVSVGAIAGLASSLMLLSGFNVVNHIFVSNNRVALSVLSFAAPIAQVTIPYIANALLDRYYWNGTFLVIGALLPLNCVPCGLVLWSSEQFMRSKPKLETVKAKQNWRKCSWLTNAAFVLFLLTTFLFSFFGPIETFYVVDLGIMKGFSRQSGAGLLAINGIFSFIGRSIGTTILRLLPKTTPDFHIGYGLLFWGGAHLLVVYATQYWTMVLAMTVRGFSMGIVFAVSPSIHIDLRGPDVYTETVAICNLVLGLGNTVSGYIGGLTVDITGSYNLIFYMAAAGQGYCCFSMAVIYLVRKRRQRKDQQSVPYQTL